MDSYAESWKGYKKLRNLTLFLFVFYLPIAALNNFILIHTAFYQGWMVGVIPVVWMIAFIIAVVRLNAFKCPRCGKWFSGTWWYNIGIFARKCVHCSLPKYANAHLSDSEKETIE